MEYLCRSPPPSGATSEYLQLNESMVEKTGSLWTNCQRINMTGEINIIRTDGFLLQKGSILILEVIYFHYSLNEFVMRIRPRAFYFTFLYRLIMNSVNFCLKILLLWDKIHTQLFCPKLGKACIYLLWVLH